MLNKIKRLLGLTPKGGNVDTDLEEVKLNLPSEVNYNAMDPVKIIGNENSDYRILLMDDFVEQFTLYELDFNRIKRRYEYDILKEFKVYEAIGAYAGFMTHKLLNELPGLNVAVLDMTLEMSIKLSNGDIIEYDGVDIAIDIIKRFPECEIVFCTAHSLNKRDPLMSKYITKFEEATGKEFDPYYMSKADKRSDIIYEHIRKAVKQNEATTDDNDQKYL